MKISIFHNNKLRIQIINKFHNIKRNLIIYKININNKFLNIKRNLIIYKININNRNKTMILNINNENNEI